MGIKTNIIAAIIIAVSASKAVAEDTVRYATDGYGLGALIIIAAEEGYLEDEGIKPIIQYFAAGVDTVDSVLAGQADFGVIMDVPILTRFASGKLISPAFLGEPAAGWHKLFVNSEMKEPEDYKDKKYGVVAGTAQEFITRTYLNQLGVNPETEAELVSFGAVFDIVGAMKAGRIDGGWIWGEGVDVMKADSNWSFAGDDSNVEQSSVALLVTMRDYAGEKSELVVKSLRAMQKAIDKVEADLPGAATTVANALGAETELVQDAIEGTNYSLSFAEVPAASLKQKYDFFVNAGVITTPYDFAGQFDTTALRSAIPDADISALVE